MRVEYICEFRDHPNINDKGALREKVVRCRDCKWFDAHTYPCLCYRTDHSLFVDPDGFCAWAERKD